MTTSQFKRNQPTAPTAVSATAVAGGGTFANVAQFYKITTTGAGTAESAGSNEVTATPALNGHIDLIWTNPAGATAVKIYRGTVTNTENTLVVQLSGNPTTYTDNNVSAGAATPPAATAFGNITKSGTQPLKSNIPAVRMVRRRDRHHRRHQPASQARRRTRHRRRVRPAGSLSPGVPTRPPPARLVHRAVCPGAGCNRRVPGSRPAHHHRACTFAGRAALTGGRAPRLPS